MMANWSEGRWLDKPLARLIASCPVSALFRSSARAHERLIAPITNALAVMHLYQVLQLSLDHALNLFHDIVVASIDGIARRSRRPLHFLLVFGTDARGAATLAAGTARRRRHVSSVRGCDGLSRRLLRRIVALDGAWRRSGFTRRSLLGPLLLSRHT